MLPSLMLIAPLSQQLLILIEHEKLLAQGGVVSVF
jgi:hypothetical protein